MKYTFEENKLKINLAGFKKEEISIEQEHDLLTIKSVKDIEVSKFKEPFLFQFHLSRSQVPKASLEDGILTIEFPPKEKTKIQIT